MKGYLQAIMFFEECKGGKLYVYVAGGTTLATIYDPISDDPITNPVDIDIDGYVGAFHVDDDYIYDIKATDYLGVTKITREYIAVGGGSGEVGPQGPQGVKGDKGDKGDTGSSGVNGTNGTNGTNGIDGVDGVSLIEVRVDPDSLVNEVQYRLSSDETLWIDAGPLDPLGRGLVKVSANDTEGLLNTKLLGTAGSISITSSDTTMTFDLDPSLLVRIGDLEDIAVDHEARIDVLEAAKSTKEVIYGGAIGDTTVVIPHTLGTSNLSCSCYNTIDNSLIFLSVIVSDTQISIQGLNPLITTNQIKVVLIK